jgi:hypothetical protein
LQKPEAEALDKHIATLARLWRFALNIGQTLSFAGIWGALQAPVARQARAALKSSISKTYTAAKIFSLHF